MLQLLRPSKEVIESRFASFLQSVRSQLEAGKPAFVKLHTFGLTQVAPVFACFGGKYQQLRLLLRLRVVFQTSGITITLKLKASVVWSYCTLCHCQGLSVCQLWSLRHCRGLVRQRGDTCECEYMCVYACVYVYMHVYWYHTYHKLTTSDKA